MTEDAQVRRWWLSWKLLVPLFFVAVIIVISAAIFQRYKSNMALAQELRKEHEEKDAISREAKVPPSCVFITYSTGDADIAKVLPPHEESRLIAEFCKSFCKRSIVSIYGDSDIPEKFLVLLIESIIV